MTLFSSTFKYTKQIFTSSKILWLTTATEISLNIDYLKRQIPEIFDSGLNRLKCFAKVSFSLKILRGKSACPCNDYDNTRVFQPHKYYSLREVVTVYCPWSMAFNVFRLSLRKRILFSESFSLIIRGPWRVFNSKL